MSWTIDFTSNAHAESLKVWDRCDKRLIRAYQGHSGSVLCLTFNEKYLITGSSDHSILIWSRDTLKPTPLIYRIQDAHSDSVLSLSVTSDPVETAKELLISSSKNGSIRIWSLPEASLKQTLIGHRSAVNACDCHSGFIVSASGDRTLRVWDLRSGNTLRSLVGHERGVACVSFNDRLVVSGSSDFTIRIWYVSCTLIA